MKQLTFSVFAALCFLALHFSAAEPGQFQSRGHIVGQPRFGSRFSSPAFRGSQVIIVTLGPVRVFRPGPFQRVIIVPNHNFVRRRVIVSHPFLLLSSPPGLRVIVQNGPRVIFFDENSEALATPTEDILTDEE